MKGKFFLFGIALLFISAAGAESFAAVEWDVLRVLELDQKPRDAVMSANGKWIYVLTEKGEVLIYTPNGKIQGRIPVGDAVDGIKAGPREDILLLTSRKEATVKIITLDFIQTFDINGSPFKGPPDAPVAIVTFSDFQ